MGIDYSVRGHGEPVVLIHGLFGSRENLGALAKLLSEQFKVYSIDLPNHGRSEHIDNFDLHSMAEAIKNWMQRVDLPQAHFVGHSLGGKAAMELALSHPECVVKLAVADIAPVAYGHRHEDVFAGLLAIDLESISSRVEADRILQQRVPEPAVRSFLLKNLQKTADGKFQWRMHVSAIHKHYADLIKANSELCIDKPVLFLKAENSDYIKAEYKEAILKRFPKAELKVVSNTGHWLHAEKPDLVARLLTRFLLA
ncbi:alpha/beta fold hydrolase [Agaribacterium haliotis]|uniref:alpha/beta fold hydrolase n=1 Tax=Agaribacterium haliotis TaxID=2013869 RepID=UPI000BB594A2|nr:alpha/beta fold hydrolase [Agaribacterium haliotis]